MATSLGIGLGEDDVDRRNRAIRDEALRAVEHILVAIEHSRGLHAGNVGTSVGLGQAERRETVVDGFVNKVLSLLGGTLQVNVAECNEVRDERISVGRIDLGKLFEHHGARLVIKTHAAEFLGDLHEVQP